MFTVVKGRAANAASEYRRTTSVSQSTLLADFGSLVNASLQDSTVGKDQFQNYERGLGIKYLQ
jgi:hypothetical protein